MKQRQALMPGLLLEMLQDKYNGLEGVKLVISDSHSGLKAAIRQVFSASWQR
ncbi:transposase, partial [Enterobacter mori]|uniref:transposase n=1 Tax=Enterobacter mori TaxID=539813 RepID=UPI003BB80468